MCKPCYRALVVTVCKSCYRALVVLVRKPCYRASVTVCNPGLEASVIVCKPGSETSVLVCKPGSEASVMVCKPGLEASVLVCKPGIEASVRGCKPGLEASVRVCNPGLEASVFSVQTGFRGFSFSVQTGFRGTQRAQKAVVIFPHTAGVEGSGCSVHPEACCVSSSGLVSRHSALRLPSALQLFSSTCLLLPSAITNNYLHNLLPHSSSIASFKSAINTRPLLSPLNLQCMYLYIFLQLFVRRVVP